MTVDEMLDGDVPADAPTAAVQLAAWFALGALTVAAGATTATVAFVVWLGRRIDVPVRIRLRR